jgi:Uma2 family endonuclease
LPSFAPLIHYISIIILIPEDIYWLIEISDSTLGKDLTDQKNNLFSVLEIQEYWIIDLNSKNLKVFQNPREKDYQINKEYQGLDSFLLCLFLTINISVDTLIRKVKIYLQLIINERNSANSQLL